MSYKKSLRSSSKDMADESSELKDYIEKLIEPLVKSSELKTLLDGFKTEVLEKIGKLEKELKEKDSLINNQSQKIIQLESNLAVVKNSLDVVLERCDDNEQYSRRQCLRIHGIEVVDEEKINETLKSCYDAVKLPFNEDDIDRAHRIGKVKDSKDKTKKCQSIIVKFKSWKAREIFYKARPRSEKPGQSKSFTVSLDLTKRRLTLLNYAREKLLQSASQNIKFVYADINCTLGVRLNDNSKKIFNNKESFDTLFNC